MHALVIGATGATGSDLLPLLLDDPKFSKVSIFVRRDFPTQHPKLQVHQVDFTQIDTWKDKLQGDVLFSCLGTTLKDAGSREKQFEIDFTYQYEVAKAAKSQGTSCLALVSTVMANPKSSTFYLKIKGQLEEAVQQLGFERTYILRPPALIRKHTKRAGERVIGKILQVITSVGVFANLKPMRTETVAQALHAVAIQKDLPSQVIENKLIRALAVQPST